MKPIKLNIPDDLAAWLNAHCERTGLKRTTAIVRALGDYRIKTDAEFRALEAMHRKRKAT
jgi:hypothetical protein